MAMTAVAVRQAFVEDGKKFKQWVDGCFEPSRSGPRKQMALKDLHYDTPELPQAGADDGPAPGEDESAGE